MAIFTSTQGKIKAILVLLLIPSIILHLTDSSVLNRVIDVIVKSYMLHRVAQKSHECHELLGGINKEVVVILRDEALFLLAFKIVTMVAAIATIYASAYTGKELGIKELFSRFAKWWKQPIITIVYNQIIELGNLGLLALLVGFVVLLYKVASVLVAITIGRGIAAFVYISSW